MAQNFYLVLGVSRDADPLQIRSAYRRLVRQYHPDVSHGPTEPFLEVQRAYEVLMDPAARQNYDDQSRPGAIRVRTETEPDYRPNTAPQSRGYEWPASSGSGSVDALFGRVDEFFGGFVPGIFARVRRRGEAKDLYVELILNPDEAAAGGIYPLQVPVRPPCEECGGTGVVGRLHCSSCRGESVDYPEIRIAVPAGVVDGQRTQLSLEDIGLGDTRLNVLVSVRG